MLSKILRQMLADGASAEQIVHVACTGLLEIEERSLGRKERNRQAARKYRSKINDSVITVITNHDDAKNNSKINGRIINNHHDGGVSSSKKEKEEERASEFSLSAEVNGTAVLPINGRYFFEAGVIRLI